MSALETIRARLFEAIDDVIAATNENESARHAFDRAQRTYDQIKRSGEEGELAVAYFACRRTERDYARATIALEKAQQVMARLTIEISDAKEQHRGLH